MVNSELTPSVSRDPKDLEGTWTLVSIVTERDGKRFDAYGPDAKAIWCSIRSGDIQSSSFRVASRSLRRIAAPARRQMRASLLFLEASLISALTSSTRRIRVSRFKSSVRHFPTGTARTRNVRLVSGVMSCTSQTPTRRAAGWRQQSSSAQSVHARSSNQGNARSASSPSRHFVAAQQSASV